MSALADTLRALMPFAQRAAGMQVAPNDARFPEHSAALTALRKHAPCNACKGEGVFYEEYDERFKSACRRCSGAGSSLASVESAIAQKDALAAAQDRVCSAASAYVAGLGDSDLRAAVEALQNLKSD